MHALELSESSTAGEATLTISGLTSPASCPLAQLLAAALPPGSASSLVACRFDRCMLNPGQLGGVASLAALRELSLQSCWGRGQHVDAALAELLQQAPQVTSLRVDDCLSASVPACVQQRSGLRALSLSWSWRLRALPAGPYLLGEATACYISVAAKQVSASFVALRCVLASGRRCCYFKPQCMLLRECLRYTSAAALPAQACEGFPCVAAASRSCRPP